MNMRKLVGRSFGKTLCLVLAVALATGPTANVVGQTAVVVEDEPLELPSDLGAGGVGPKRELPGNDTTLLAAPEAGKINLTYVSPAAVVLVSLHPHQLLTSPNTAMFPVEVVSAAGLQQFGIDPVDISDVVAFAEPPMGISVPYGVMLKFTRPFSLDDIPAQLRAHTEPGDFAGKRYLRSPDLRLPSFYMPDDRTLLVMTEITLQKALAPQGPPKSSPLVDRVSGLPSGDDLYAVVDVASLRPIVGPLLKAAVAQPNANFPEEARPFLEVLDLVSAVDLSVNLTNKNPSILAIHANDAASADRLEQLYDLAKAMQRKQALEGAAQLKQSQDPIQRAVGNYVERVSQMTSDAYKIERRGENLILFQTTLVDGSPQNQLVMVAVTGILVALLLPAVQAARIAARRSQSMNNMKQLLLSMHVHADAKKSLPPHASYSPDGKPLLSWRVHMLPYLEEQALYSKFKLDEPWDSPHNKALIPLMPHVFASPALPPSPDGKTVYLALVGPQCILDGSPKGIGFAQISDGTSKTIMLVEADADQAVEWTKPDDLEFDPAKPMAGFGKLYPNGSNAGFADGSVRFVSATTEPTMFRGAVTRNGREIDVVPR
jgi:prepilin-type processing-associated H-X9-DG protein